MCKDIIKIYREQFKHLLTDAARTTDSTTPVAAGLPDKTPPRSPDNGILATRSKSKSMGADRIFQAQRFAHETNGRNVADDGHKTKHFSLASFTIYIYICNPIVIS
jgi:hypothetical protein